MKKENTLIAEFMQKFTSGFGLYDYNGNHYKMDELQFHTSWDWLMPVIAKCAIINDEEGFEPFVDTCDLRLHSEHPTYKEVIRFIKLQNK